MKQFFGYIAAGIGTIVFVILAFFGNKKDNPPAEPTELDERAEELEAKIEDIEKKEEKLKEEGVEDLDPADVVDYWDHNGEN